jgi:aminopeptidase N
MWFYGLVGNDQGRDPWLDESFATFAQMVADGEDSSYPPDVRSDARENVGRPITFWTEYRRADSIYYDAVYTAGGAALAEARERAGQDDFDAALREYVSRNAYSVASPEDVAAAFADLPEALAVLRDAGALP